MTAPGTAPVLEVIRRRRAERWYSDESLPEGDVMAVAEAAARAPSGSGFRPNIFVVVTSPTRVSSLFSVSPGMFSRPSAILVVCVDWAVIGHLPVEEASIDHPTWFDIGAAFENALIVAEDLGIGACPVTSFHRGAVQSILGLPETTIPYAFVSLGRPAVERGAHTPRKLRLGRIHRDRYEVIADG